MARDPAIGRTSRCERSWSSKVQGVEKRGRRVTLTHSTRRCMRHRDPRPDVEELYNTDVDEESDREEAFSEGLGIGIVTIATCFR